MTIIPLKFNIHLREPVSGITSFLSFGLAIAGLVLMVIAAAQHGNAWHIISFSMFGSSLILLYLSSALYHLLPLKEKGVIFIYPLTQILPTEAMIWLVLGGLMYTIGAIFYALKWPNLFPSVFGFHELWHLFIMTGSFSHFWVVYRYLL